MSRFFISHAAEGRCRIRHQRNDSTIVTDLPPEYGGEGRSFSSTDMVAAAVGTCYFTTIERILLREQINPADVSLEVSKELSHQPKRISAIRLTLTLPKNPSKKLLALLNKAIDLCPVKRSLHKGVATTVSITVSDQSTT